MVSPRETEPGQIRAPSSVGGVEHHLAKGDVVDYLSFAEWLGR